MLFTFTKVFITLFVFLLVTIPTVTNQDILLTVVSRLPNNATVLRTKTLGTSQWVQQTNVNLEGPFTLHSITALQDLRRVQLHDSNDFVDLRDDGELIISLGDMTYQEFDLKDESCSNGVELYPPVGLSGDIVLLITCKGGKVLCLKYSNGEYSIDSIFVSEYKSSTPVIVNTNGISTAVYTIEAEEIFALAIRSLESSGYEQIMYENTFEDVFGSCVETLSFNETHIRLSCPNTHNFYLVDGSGKTDGKEIHPQGVGDLVNIYNEDMILVVGSSFVTINTKESTNYCALDIPTPVTRVEHARTNGRLLLLFLTSQGIYKYDSSTSCVNENLVILANETLLGLSGDYQNYLIFGNLLVYTVMKNGLYSSHGIDLSTSENLGVLANHQNKPLLYGFVYNNDTVTSRVITATTTCTSSTSSKFTSTSTSTSVPNTSTSSAGMATMTTFYFISLSSTVTMTTSSSITTVSSTSTSIHSSIVHKTNSISSLTSVTMTTIHSTTDPEAQSKPLKFKNFIPYLVIVVIFIVVCIIVIILILILCYRKNSRRKRPQLVIPEQEKHCYSEEPQRTSIISSNESNSPPVETTSLQSNDDTLPIQVEPSVPVSPSAFHNTDTSTVKTTSSCDNYETQPIQVEPSVPVSPSAFHNTDTSTVKTTFSCDNYETQPIQVEPSVPVSSSVLHNTSIPPVGTMFLQR